MKKELGYIIYLDLLGYKNILSGNLEDDVEQLRDFIDSFNKSFISKRARLMYGTEYDPDRLFFKCYSDNFLIFYRSEKNDALPLSISILLASHLAGLAIMKGFMLRGSIVFGELDYSKDAVFGKKIIEAYTLESSNVFPSINLSPNLQKLYSDGRLYQGELLSPFSTYHRNDYSAGKVFYSGIEKLVKRLNYQSVVEERTLTKYRWLINEYNRYFEGACHLTFVEEPSHFDLFYEDTSSDI